MKTISEILKAERQIWPEKMRLSEIVVVLMVVVGDLARYARKARKDSVEYEDIVRELGNLISSSIRWCDDLTIDPNHAIEVALEAQRQYRAQEKVT